MGIIINEIFDFVFVLTIFQSIDGCSVLKNRSVFKMTVHS